MSEEILENIETPIEKETQIKNENSNEAQAETEIIEIPQRTNPFCVISKGTFGKYAVHDIQTNSAWSENPYGDGYAVVPDEMVLAIMETMGFCDIELNEDETEVVSFTATEIPTIEPPKETATATTDDIINAMLGLEG